MVWTGSLKCNAPASWPPSFPNCCLASWQGECVHVFMQVWQIPLSRLTRSLVDTCTDQTRPDQVCCWTSAHDAACFCLHATKPLLAMLVGAPCASFAVSDLVRTHASGKRVLKLARSWRSLDSAFQQIAPHLENKLVISRWLWNHDFEQPCSLNESFDQEPSTKKAFWNQWKSQKQTFSGWTDFFRTFFTENIENVLELGNQALITTQPQVTDYEQKNETVLNFCIFAQLMMLMVALANILFSSFFHKTC